MNKEELIAEVSKELNITKKDTNNVLNAFIDIVEDTVSKGGKVTLAGFGTWEAKKRAARTGRNIHSGMPINIPERTVPTFHAGKQFKGLFSK